MARLFMVCAATDELAFARVKEIAGNAQPVWRAVGDFSSARAEDQTAQDSLSVGDNPYCVVFELA